VTTGKLNCSSRCSLDGTRRATLRGLLEVCRGVQEEDQDSIGTNSLDSSARKGSTVQGQYKSEARIRLPGRAVQYRGPVQRVKGDSSARKGSTVQGQYKE
jgi:hypothetical protein